jgi:threonyl-tRNA synthetase
LKIREAELQKIPYMIVLGDREVKQNLISPRARSGKTLAAMPLEAFVKIIREECKIVAKESV